jgi:hypothetical protein
VVNLVLQQFVSIINLAALLQRIQLILEILPIAVIVQFYLRSKLSNPGSLTTGIYVIAKKILHAVL